MRESTRIGIVVDAGPTLGYGHVVRCVRLARALGEAIAFYPMSDYCRQFLALHRPHSEIRNPNSDPFPPIVITDLRESHGITAAIRRQGATHVSIHDLGLAQCQSDVVIDGSIVQLFPYPESHNRSLFLGPAYMITRPMVTRQQTEKSVFVTLGGGASAEYAAPICEQLRSYGLRVITTGGLGSGNSTSEQEIEHAMATCAFAISASGTSLYDLLASGIPTIALAVDRLQLRTAEAFRELGAVVSAGLIGRVPSRELMGYCYELLHDRALANELSAAGKTLVDGRGLSRVTEIVRNLGRELRRDSCLKEETTIFTTC